MNAMTKLVLILVFQILAAAAAEIAIKPVSISRQGKDFYPYPDEAKPDYPPLTYSPSYHFREGFPEYPPNPLSALVEKSLSFILLKLGVVALIKAIVTGLILMKIPLFFLKLVFLKTFLFPVLIAPLLIHLLGKEQMMEMRPSEEERPTETTGEMGRMIADDLSTRVWRSMKTFAESDQCVERAACIIGAYNKDSADHSVFKRAFKLFEKSSPTNLQIRLMSVKNAFTSGLQNGSCYERNFICHGPELFIQQGNEKMKLL